MAAVVDVGVAARARTATLAAWPVFGAGARATARRGAAGGTARPTGTIFVVAAVLLLTAAVVVPRLLERVTSGWVRVPAPTSRAPCAGRARHRGRRPGNHVDLVRALIGPGVRAILLTGALAALACMAARFVAVHARWIRRSSSPPRYLSDALGIAAGSTIFAAVLAVAALAAGGLVWRHTRTT